jgi:hypothetical protein
MFIIFILHIIWIMIVYFLRVSSSCQPGAPDQSAQNWVDTKPSECTLSRGESTPCEDYGKSVRASSRTDAPPTSLLAEDQPQDCPAASESPLEKTLDWISSIPKALDRQIGQERLSGKGPFGGVPPPPVIRDWINTPVDPTAAWIGLVLNGQAAPYNGDVPMFRDRWVHETILAATRNCKEQLNGSA